MNSIQHQLRVTKPCQETWSSMTETGNGRHCNSCDKIVIDFSILRDDEIKAFFIKSSNNPVCGRFHKNQIDRIKICISPFVLNKSIPFWKKFLIIFLVCFGSNLYPFDTILHSKSNLYAQSPSNKKLRKKVNYKFTKKKIKKIKEVSFIFEQWTEHIVLGFAQIIPAPTAMPTPSIARIKLDSPSKNLDVVTAKTTFEQEKDKKKKPSGKKHSENEKEYILPPRFRYRKRKLPIK